VAYRAEGPDGLAEGYALSMETAPPILACYDQTKGRATHPA
jgi:hypothetical protein